ncbi:MAG: hypothetical protein K0R40_2155 [Burkholderiales bacterium]|nr:hypothetical protein [Burkholderiales bacterium]
MQTQWLPEFMDASRRYLQLPLVVLPQILAPQYEPVIESQHRSAELRERTLNQGESERMSY